MLVVDDDKMSVLLNKRMVIKSGLSSEPLSFNNGKEAFDYLGEHIQEDHSYLVFLDINMPIMNGWQFLDSIQTMTIANNILVVMVTSSIEKVDQDKARTYPQVVDYIEKPYPLTVFNRIKDLPRVASLL